MEYNEAIALLKTYTENLNKSSLSAFEKQLVKQLLERRYFFFYGFSSENIVLPKTCEEFIKNNNSFNGLLPDGHDKLCFYLEHIQKFTCNRGLIRMDARSSDFSYYTVRVISAIDAFFAFYGTNMSLKKLIYGEYRQTFSSVSFAPVIAAELLAENADAVNYCKDVLLSENNTAVITRDVIEAIEQSENRELQDLLTQIFLNAKLQEGLRQAVIETADEGQIEYFFRIIDTVKNENLLRFSSVQRGILTWIGIGYETVEEKQIKFIFSVLCDYLSDEEKRTRGLKDENPLCVYLALYCKGIYNVDEAIAEAVEMLSSPERHIVASALIYLKLTNHFNAIKYSHLLEEYRDDEWITALCLSELMRLDLEKIRVMPRTAFMFFDSLDTLASRMKAQENYNSKGFEWFSLTLTKFTVVHNMFALIKKYPEEAMIERLLPYVAGNLGNDSLKTFMSDFFPQLPTEVKKAFMAKEIISQNEELGKLIAEEYFKTDLNDDDILELESRLKTKKGSARALIIEVLASQDRKTAEESFARLSASPSKIIQESALELKQKVPEYFEDEPKPPIAVKGKEEGFGMYTPYATVNMSYTSRLKFNSKWLFGKKKFCDLSFLQVMTKKQVIDYITLWNSRIEAHAKDEYEVRGEYRQVGDRAFYPLDYRLRSLDALPLADVWRAYFEADKITEDMLFQLRFYIASSGIFLNKFFPDNFGLFQIDADDIKDPQYYNQFCYILRYYFYEFENSESCREKAAAMLELFNRHTSHTGYWEHEPNGEKYANSFTHLYLFEFVVDCLHLTELNDEDFKKYFPLVYESYIVFNLHLDKATQNKFKIPPLVMSRAALLGLVPQTMLIESIMDTHTEQLKRRYSVYSSDTHRLYDAYKSAYYDNRSMFGAPSLSLPEKHGAECDYLRKTLDLIADNLLLMESTRINDMTPVTEYVKCLKVVRGMKHLISALRVIKNEELKRQTYGDERGIVFSNVIRNCYPVEGDSAEMLRKENFPEKRLVEVAMMAPQWIDIIAEVLGWDGFKEACYYFIAHMKEYDKDRKKAEIARYTDLNPEDLNDGAFDMEWCKNINETLGEKRMKMVYESAKFLCENSFHTRARKYADACLGKTSKEEFLKQSEEKRNKDALNAYCICPIEDDGDLLERYKYVRQFLKESKKFGAQRQASEKRASEIALMNLARNSKYENVTRLSWIMESRIVRTYDYALTPQKLDDIEIWIEIDEHGQNKICVSKNGKALKTIPAKYKNNETVDDIKSIHKMWTEQYKRSRSMLEQAMEERTRFTYEEIKVIMTNPIVAPMLSKLVLYSGNSFGYYENEQLKGLRETVSFDDEIRIAHPYDLYEKGVWHDYQEDVFKNKTVQPFKQIFRELYLKTEDEMNDSMTKRYTGYQIQPKKAAGALKARKWNVSYENGLEKVNYKDNIIVNLYAEADWFSPSDIEAPSIDYVSFYSRLDYKPVKIKDIDDVLFSETMRDVDLAVSTAYVGGVDPLTSYSTIELRRTIVEYTCKLMGLANVTLGDRFVNIEGTLNSYSIHMGSGVVHQSGGGSIHVLPVYSEKRGKVYLPFLDDDPATALLISKVVMFAEDNKIKDPAILQQIVGR